jgi:hypothetical protein
MRSCSWERATAALHCLSYRLLVILGLRVPLSAATRACASCHWGCHPSCTQLAYWFLLTIFRGIGGFFRKMPMIQLIVQNSASRTPKKCLFTLWAAPCKKLSAHDVTPRSGQQETRYETSRLTRAPRPAPCQAWNSLAPPRQEIYRIPPPEVWLCHSSRTPAFLTADTGRQQPRRTLNPGRFHPSSTDWIAPWSRRATCQSYSGPPSLLSIRPLSSLSPIALVNNKQASAGYPTHPQTDLCKLSPTWTPSTSRRLRLGSSPHTLTSYRGCV